MEVLFPSGTADAVAFELFRDSLSAMNKGSDLGRLRTFFEARAMSLGGYAIDVTRCCQCGRKYAGEGTAVFNREKGGISCMKCLTESVNAPGLQPSIVALLRALQSASVEELPSMNWDAEAAEKIRAVMTLHMEYRIGRRLKSARYL
jgi:DNA repair protein RecO